MISMVQRLGAALMSHDVADSSNKSLLQELDSARSVIERLSTQNARSAGWELKLETVTQHNEDLRQELESEAHRSRAAEMRVSSLMERCCE